MNHEEIIVEAVHDLCEECMSKKYCKGICYEVERMKKLAIDIRKEEQERCIKAAHEAVIEELSDDICVDASDVARGVVNILRRKMEGGSHE